MLHGVSGSLVSAYFAEHLLNDAFAGRTGEDTRDAASRALRAWWRRDGRRLGPASSLHALANQCAVPVLTLLGFGVSARDMMRRSHVLTADVRAKPVGPHDRSLALPVIVVPWGEPMDRAWPELARDGLRLHSTWAFCVNGRAIRLCDVRRTYARGFLEFDFDRLTASDGAMVLFWAMARADALPALAGSIVAESARHGSAVCASLRQGVHDALVFLLRALLSAGRGGDRPEACPADLAATFEQALTVVYRILFLLFAEARGLVPVWHPVYRRSYTIEALRKQAETSGQHRGIWEGLQALSRLAHAGCRAGSLRVTPFNGRLFSPDRTPLAEVRRLDDTLVAQALLALTTRAGRVSRERISFRDLGVEQLGAVYESVLDYAPAVEAVPGRGNTPRPKCSRAFRVTLVDGRDARKASGTFYTPQSVTEYLVRHTLHPLVEHASADQILALRVLDPSMGSGAFLVAACRYLASAYERALVDESGRLPADVTEADRAGYRRVVAQRCLYGVDLNPMAVQVARLSLWLTTLSADRPLTFLDHHLAVGDSLIGASLDDLARQPPGPWRSPAASASLPLFESDEASSVLRNILPVRHLLATGPDDTAMAIREKERILARLAGESGPLVRLRRAADLWCACWFWHAGASVPPDAREFADLAGSVLGGPASLPPRVVEARLHDAQGIAAARRFFHWTLEFPEVFYQADGSPAPHGGFDAVVGNPPWDMLRNDGGADPRRPHSRTAAHELTRFARTSGVYRACREGHANQYQLFVERSIRLVRTGGRIGLVVPWGLASDHGSAGLRRLLFEQCNTDTLVAFENARAIFPIHRGVRFLLLSSSPGTPTTRVRCRFGERDPAVLETLGADGRTTAGPDDQITITPEFLTRVSGSGLAIPHLRTSRELSLVERLVSSWPALSSPAGWGARFRRELNATDDRALFSDRPGVIRVIEGKHVEPFMVHLARSQRFVARSGQLPSQDLRRAVDGSRLAYRDVAASTNRLTLIAAMIPPAAVTVHTLFCLKAPLARPDQEFLCGMLNSFVANFLVRLWVTTHLGAATVERLPMPRPATGSPDLAIVRRLARSLARPGRTWPGRYAALQAHAARLYGLTEGDLALVVESFPLIDDDTKTAVTRAFARLAPGCTPV
mgnify:CR=1 FL=1